MEAPRAPLAGRYRFLRGLQAGAKAVSWLATDQRTGHPVIVASLGAGRVAGLEGVVGVRHKHLTAILDMIHGPKREELPNPSAPPNVTTLAVAEFASGASMHDRLRSGPPAPTQAVAWLTQIVEAVESMHAIGGLHGAISPRSIVLEPDSGDFEGPVLTQLIAAPSGPYCSPERLRGRGPSAADDVWALYTTLYAALTGATPFGGTSREELVHSMVRVGARPLAEYGMLDATLEPIVARGLEPDPAKRETKLSGLKQQLGAWTRDHAQSEVARQPASEPPPPPPPSQDLSTEWDDDDAQTVITNSAEIFEMARQAGREAALALADAGEEEEVATRVVSMDQMIEPAAAAPPRAQAGVLPYRQDEEEEDATRIMEERAILDPLDPRLQQTLPPNRAMRGGAFPAPNAGYPPPAPTQPDLSAIDQSAPPYAAASLPAEPPKRRGLVVFVALVTFLGLGVAAYLTRGSWSGPLDQVLNGALHRGGGAAGPARITPQTAPLAKTSSPAAETHAAPSQRLPACVRSLFPPSTFKPSEGFAFLCGTSDFRGINSQLYRDIVVAGAGKVTAGMKEWSSLGWYELAVTAVVRGHCCPASAPPIALPQSPPLCPELDHVLQTLAAKPLTKQDVPNAATPFQEDVDCFFSKGVPRPYHYRDPPTAHNRSAFESFLTRAARGG
jgi:Protein kinase domain